MNRKTIAVASVWLAVLAGCGGQPARVRMAADAADVSADARAGEAALDAAVVDSVGAHDLTRAAVDQAGDHTQGPDGPPLSRDASTVPPDAPLASDAPIMSATDASTPKDAGINDGSVSTDGGATGRRLWIAATISDPVVARSALIVFTEAQLRASGPTSGPVASFGPTQLAGFSQLFTIDRSGNVWGQGPGPGPSLRRYRARDLVSSTTRLPPPDELPGLAGPLQVALPPSLDSQGNLWIPGAAGPIRFDRAQLDLPDLRGLSPSLQVNAGAGNEMTVDGYRGTLFFNQITQLRVWTTAQLTGSGASDAAPRYEVHSIGTQALTTDPLGTLWYTYGGGLGQLPVAYFEAPATALRRTFGLPASAFPDGRNRSVQGLAFDEAGNGWVTSGDNTLVKLAARDLATIAPGPNPPAPPVELVITVPESYRLHWLRWH